MERVAPQRTFIKFGSNWTGSLGIGPFGGTFLQNGQLQKSKPFSGEEASKAASWHLDNLLDR